MRIYCVLRQLVCSQWHVAHRDQIDVLPHAARAGERQPRVGPIGSTSPRKRPADGNRHCEQPDDGRDTGAIHLRSTSLSLVALHEGRDYVIEDTRYAFITRSRGMTAIARDVASAVEVGK